MIKYFFYIFLIVFVALQVAYAGPPSIPPPKEVTQAEAEAGTVTSIRSWTPERVKQAVLALGSGGLPLDTATAGDDGKYIVVDWGNSKLDYGSPAGGGDMLEAAWDGDSDTYIDQDAGGLDADISGYGAGLLGHTAGGAVQDTDTEGELETALGAINVIVSTEIDAFSEIQALVADKTLVNEEDAATIDQDWTFTTGLILGATGDITQTAAAVDWDLVDNNASALSFDAAGKTGIIDIVTTDGSEGVTMSGTLAVTGALSSSASITSGGSFIIGSADVNETELEIIDGGTLSTTQLNYLSSATGTTGTTSTNLVFSTSPTLVTPVLGVATGTSLITSGSLSSGADDTTPGSLIAYGGDAGVGGKLFLYNGTDEEGTHDYWYIEADGANLEIRTDATDNVFILNSDGSINKSDEPLMTFDDTDGANGYIEVNANDADDAEMLLQVDDSNGDAQVYIDIDGVNERVDVNYPLTATSIDAGRNWTTVSQAATPYDFSGNTECEHIYYMSAAATGDAEIDLMTSGLCDTGQGRLLTFNNMDDAQDLYIDPNGADVILINGESCPTDGDRLLLDPGEWVVLHGVSDTTWRAYGSATAGCE